jgi:hypothetical protein
MAPRGEMMRTPLSVKALEDLGRIRLSPNFFMRDFLYSEIANFYGIQNIPEDPALAIEVGKALCESLLEPLQATFGRLAIRSSYRSAAVNQLGNEKRHNCGSNESNYAGHIWDRRNADGHKGAISCVVVPWFADRYADGADWRSLAFWIHDHLPYGTLQFFPKLCAFNIGWQERPARRITSFIEPKGLLFEEPPPKGQYATMYAGFPALAA